MIEQRSLTFKAILDEAYDEVVHTVSVHAALIKSPKDITKVMKILSSKMPIPRLQHLKRVKKMGAEFWVVLDVVQNAAKRPRMSEESDEKELFTMLGDVEEVEVPANPPLTRAQFNLCKDYWPVNFHPEPDIERLLLEDTFTDEERAWHRSCTTKVLEEAAKLGANFAIVANPAQRSIVAVGSEDLKSHPLQHAGMAAVEAVAAVQRGPREPGDMSYLCTGWDVYLAVEPCPMCAMALVHSRASRVFFAKRCPSIGAIVSTCRLPFIKSLNHHYQVFEAVV